MFDMVKVLKLVGLLVFLSGCSILGSPVRFDTGEAVTEGVALDRRSDQEPKGTSRGSDEKLPYVSRRVDVDELASSSSRLVGEKLVSAYREDLVSDARFSGVEFDLDGSIGRDVDVSDMSLSEFVSLIGSDLLGLTVIFGEIPSLLDVAAPSVSFPRGTEREAVFKTLIGVVESRGLNFWLNDSVLYIDSALVEGRGLDIAIGRNIDEVPVSSSNVLQIVPVENQWDTEIDKLVSEFTDVTISRSASRNAYIFRGRSDSVRQALRLVQTLDTPSVRGKYIRRFSLTHVTSSFAATEVQKLFAAEGTASSILAGGVAAPSTLLFVPMELSNGLIVFSSSEALINRTRYWLGIVDVPRERDSEQFYIFRPKLNSADSILQTLSAFSVPSGRELSQQDRTEASTGQVPRDGGQQVRYEDATLMADRNTGGILVQSSPAAFSKLKPLLEALDVAPRQILLEVTIAEVSMQDEFKFGFEWALSNRGVNYSTVGGFGAGDISGFSVGIVKDKLLQGRAFSGSGLIDVISSPTLLVKEGMPASVSVGSRISVVGATTFDPLVGVQRQTTEAEYIDTGVSVDLTPTLVGSDVVEIDISQSISNTVSGTAGAGGNPDIFDRSLKTRVLARSGETILLGGLISDRTVDNRDGLPVVSKIPLLGGLFGAQSSQKETTELIMIVTPTVLLNSENWEESLEKFREGLRAIESDKIF